MTAGHSLRAPALFLTLAFGALAPATARGQEDAAANRPRTQPANAGGLSAEEIEALFWARQDSARMKFTEADVQFMTGMISHHAQAIVMSELAPTRGASPSVQTLAARIINSQRDEIARMQRWLELRGQPFPQVSERGHVEDMRHPHTAMPGMLTPEQLDDLRGAFGPEFDRLYLEYMIQHHGGAIVMVDDLLAVDGAAQDRAAFKLAADIQVDQITEIERMELLLDRMSNESTETREES